MELCGASLGAGHTPSAFRRAVAYGGRPQDRFGGPTRLDPPGLQPPHRQTHPHLHERGSRKAAHFRHDHSHPRKDEATIIN